MMPRDEEAIRRLIAEAPRPTIEQRDRLAVLLRIKWREVRFAAAAR